MRFGEREISMINGWLVEYVDGKILCEEDMTWQKLPNKKNITRVILKWNERWWSLDNKEYYVPPSRREMVNIVGGIILPPIVHSRTVGYYDLQDKSKVILRVLEDTGKASFETIPIGS